MHSPYKKVLFLAIGLLLSFPKLHSMDNQKSYVDIQNSYVDIEQQQIDNAHKREGQLALMISTHARAGREAVLSQKLQDTNLIRKIAENYEPEASGPVLHDTTTQYAYIRTRESKFKFKLSNQYETMGNLKARIRSALGLEALTPIMFLFAGHQLQDTLPAGITEGGPFGFYANDPDDSIFAAINPSK